MKVFFNSCLKQLAPPCMTAALALSGAGAAHAYTVTLKQVGGNVDATGSGSIDLTGLTFSGGFSSGPAALWPAVGYVNTGPTTSVGLDSYTGFSGPTSFGSGGFTGASSGTGDSVEIWGSSAQYGVPLLWVPSGYVSDTALSDASTYDGVTFASLGVTPGTYKWTWGAGANQNFTLDIATVPEPSTWAMMLTGFAGLGFAGYRASRKSAAVA